MFRSKQLVLACLLVCLFALPAAGGDFNGSKPMLCVPIEISECAPSTGCQETAAEIAGLPQFIQINAKKKSVSGKLADGTVKSAKIETKAIQEGNLVLQGMQNGRGWSMVIAEDTGKMSLSVAGRDVGFFVSGACMIP